MDIKKSFRPIIENIVAQYVPFGVGVLVVILAWFSRQLQLWQILALALGLCAVIFLLINQISLWKERHTKNIGGQSDKQIEDTLRKWFDKRHYSSKVIQDDKTLFYIVATDPQKRPLNVFKPSDNPSIICIRLAPDEKQIEELLPQPHQGLARFNIGIEMARIGLKCQAKSPMQIDQELQCDEFLTESSFWNAIDRIRQGHVLIQAHLSRAVLEAKLEAQSKTTELTVRKEDSPKK